MLKIIGNPKGHFVCGLCGSIYAVLEIKPEKVYVLIY